MGIRVPYSRDLGTPSRRRGEGAPGKLNCCSPLRPLQLLLSGFSCRSSIASASAAAPRLRRLQLLLLDCVPFSMDNPCLQLLHPDCVRFYIWWPGRRLRVGVRGRPEHPERAFNLLPAQCCESASKASEVETAGENHIQIVWSTSTRLRLPL